jgi:hypothetical protein
VKVIALTRGGLTRVPDKRDEISHRNKLVSDDRLNCKESADVIVVQLNEGLNNNNLEGLRS